METRLPPKQKIVGSTPTEIVFLYPIYYFLLALFAFFLSLCCKQGWPSGPRRQFKVLFSSEAWVRTPPLAFFLFLFSPFLPM